MATFSSDQQQQTNEIHTYTVDFTNDLPSGGTVTAGTATHTPPSGNATALTTSVTSPYVYVTVPVLSVTGLHYVDVLATFNNSDKSSVRIPINIVYPAVTARIGLLSLIAELRSLCEANPDDYSIAGIPYWSDAQLQDILDIHRLDIIFEQLQMFPVTVSGGTLNYLDYRSSHGYLEQTTGGTAILYLQDSAGANISSANYAPDYRRGTFQFSADQRGSVYYMTGRSYDLRASAADIWRRKAAHVAPTSFNFSTDNHSVSRAQVYDHCLQMAEFFEARQNNSVQTVPMFRSDIA